MRAFFPKLQEPAYAALRATSGFMFLFHGLAKLGGVWGKQIAFADKPQMWIGGLIELVCGALIAVGLLTRWSAFLASGTMAVAYFQFHVDGNWAGWHWLPAVNHGELAALYSFVFLYITGKGAGVLSVDRVMGRDA